MHYLHNIIDTINKWCIVQEKQSVFSTSQFALSASAVHQKVFKDIHIELYVLYVNVHLRKKKYKHTTSRE